MQIDNTYLTVPATGRLIDPSLFVEVDGELRLVGSRCNECSTVTFPTQDSCPSCTGQNVGPHPLAPVGTLWASTVQRFTPKTPYLGADTGAAMYGVGYVDLGGEVLVESRLVGDVDSFHIGMPVVLTLETLPSQSSGDRADEPIWSFAFVAQGVS